ncbi:dirigent protein 2-like [Magnolia sinica]|uniref:dirigent protein 2-like n=1 Tax=Magnolia sinica TaxID=86752 RepID=UPI0026583002|nr:dirigent protein 2-like [Magnolia sinica]
MSNTHIFILFIAIFFYVAYNLPTTKPKETNLVFYVHDYLTGHDASAATVAGKSGPSSSILHFGTILVVDDVVTEGPTLESAVIGRAQGMYINSALDGKGLHLVFSVIFTGGPYNGSTLEIQGADLFSLKVREFGVLSGTGFFRFVKGYGFMETEFLDLASLRGILKLNVTVRHY